VAIGQPKAGPEPPKGENGQKGTKASRPQNRRPSNDRPENAIPGRTREAAEAAIPTEGTESLTDRQRLFVREYLIDLNATQAAIRAGYSPNSARQVGHVNMKNHYIMAAIEAALMELGGITRSRIVDELGAIAFSDIRTIMSWDNEALDLRPGDRVVIDGEEVEASICAFRQGITRVIRSKVRMLPSATMDPSISRVIAEVSQTDKGSLKVKLHDKLAALDKLARALGMYSETSQVAKDGPPLTAVTIYSGRPDNLPALGERAAEIGDAPGDDGD
jgi:phage terminase small subunit